MSVSFFRSWFRRGERTTQPIRSRATPPKKRPRTRPTLEALEDRLVPTVAFIPQMGNGVLPTVTSPTSAESASLQNPPVVLIFTGSYWQTKQGGGDEQTMTNAVSSILSGPYLSKLTQYGSDGHAHLAGTPHQTNQTPTLTSNTTGKTPTASDLLNFVKTITSQNPSWVPSTSGNPRQAPIYVIINDPQDAGNGSWGYNKTDNVTHAIYEGNATNSDGSLNMDLFTRTFSHELAEAITSSITVSNPGHTTDQNGGPNEICDGEPDNDKSIYAYRLNGNLVQPYWSQSDSAFVVPDGYAQTFTLQPIWSGGSFTGQYNLSVDGDQHGANWNDQITIAQVASGTQMGGVAVDLNGETFTFDRTIFNGSLNAIPNIYVNTKGGTNQVNVTDLALGVSVSVDSYSAANSTTPSNDTVTIGSNGSLANIGGTVNVSNSSGQTKLVVEDNSDTSARSVGVTANAVTFSNLGQVNYSGATTEANGAIVGVTSLEVDGSQGGDTYNVYSTAANTPLTLVTAAPGGSSVNTVYIKGSQSAVTVNSYGNDNVVVGNAGSLAGIGGPVNVSNTSGQDKLTIDDSLDNYARSIDISSNAVKFAATASDPAVTINYSPAVMLNNGQMLGVSQLTLWDAAGANQIEVDSVGANTPTTIEGDYFDTLTGAAANQVQFKPYRWYRTGPHL
jgi:hypothetical protein